jgi:hypothetical protein
MIFEYAGATLAQDSFVWTYSHRDEKNQGGIPYRRQTRWTVSGHLYGDTPVQIAAAIETFLAMFGTHYRDARLLDNSNNVLHQLLSSSSLTGVTVEDVNLPLTRNDYTNKVPFSVTLAATYAIGPDGTNGQGLLISWRETLTTWGGGARYTLVECAEVPPQKQMLNRHTTFYATQAGSASGRSGYPAYPPPLFPGDLVTDNPHLTFTNPDRMGQGQEGFAVSWRYEYASAAPLVGTPGVWL